MANSTQIGSIHVDASIGTAQYTAGAKKLRAETAALERDVKTRFSGMGAAVKGGIAGLAGALSVGLFVRIGKAALDYAASIGEVSKQLGLTTRDLQTFRFAATQLGVSQSDLETGLQRLTVSLGQVAAGAKAPAAALKAIGLNAQEVARMNTGDAFRAISDALAKVESRAQRAAVEVALFGRSGAKLDNLLSGGSGALNELAIAAERLGIVLSDEQIQKADETADKLDALKTVISARIAGAVADNADAILHLADSIASLVDEVVRALPQVRKFFADLKLWQADAIETAGKILPLIPGVGPALAVGTHARRAQTVADLRAGAAKDLGAAGLPGRSVTVSLGKPTTLEQRLQTAFARGSALPGGMQIGARSTGGIDPFLARGGGGGRRKARDRSAEEAERKRLQALREANQFDQELRRAKIDVLEAEKQLAGDYAERTAISVQILDAERAAYEAQLEFEVAAGERTQVQADQLLLEYDRKDALERQALLEEEQTRRREEIARLAELDFDLERDRLESEAQLAETAAEQRDVQLRLLDLYYRQERARLNAILAEEKVGSLAWEEARRRLANLDATQANDRQAVLNRTRGPMEEFSAQFGDITDELEELKVRGILGAVDALTALTGGFDDFRDAAINAIKAVIAELIRLQLMKLAVSLLGSATGAPGGGLGIGAPGTFGTDPSVNLLPGGVLPPLGFAGGGGFTVLGRAGLDKNVMSINGLPIAGVSYGERVSVSNDNARGPMLPPLHFHFAKGTTREEARETAFQASRELQRRLSLGISR